MTPLQVATSLDFEGLPERFEPIRKLGEGGFGRVYAVRDLERDVRVALKILSQANPKNLLSFKDEFRSLTDLVHPNLVTLYELHAHEGCWFFTMELLGGTDFLDYVRGGGATHHDHATVRATVDSLDEEIPHTLEFEVHASDPGTTPAIDPSTLEQSSWSQACSYEEDRLREALGQLTTGIHTLHRAGMLHRDIKPSNVMVEPGGQLVLLDFGLIAQLDPTPMIESVRRAGRGKKARFVGTPHYMSPEQAMGMEIGPPSDWYAAGAMLYEVLTGRRPIEGPTPLQILLRKQSVRPAHVLEFAPDAPEDLAELCMAMLARRPEKRPGYEEIARALGARGHASSSRRAVARTSRGPFIGRTEHLARLRDALERLRSERAPAIVNVVGRSGMGKSALVQQFLLELGTHQPDVLILQGRCFENELLPFKALDQLIDLLSRYLELLPEEELAEFEQIEGLPALVRLFPVLARASSLEHILDSPPAGDANQQRRKAFEALRRVCSFLGAERPLVLYIDDVQWGDEDSAVVLEQLLRGPDAPPVLLLVSYREEDLEGSPFLTPFLENQSRRAAELDVTTIVVDALAEEEATQLARALLPSGEDEPKWRAQLTRIAREAAGHPMFIDELARYLRTHSDPTSGLTDLEEVLYRRIVTLPERARRLLQVISVSGQPLDRQLARELAELEGEEQSTLALLRTELFVRQSSESAQEGLEIYHARIRETVVARMRDEDLRATHMALACALEDGAQADPELVARHFLGAHAPRRAVPFLERAAAHATEVFAFERAAQSWELVIEHGDWEPGKLSELYEKLGRVRGYLGQGEQAADAYERARSYASGASVQRLRRLVGDQLLKAGHFERGSAILEELLLEAGFRPPLQGSFLIAEILAMRARISWRGLEPAPERELSEQERDRLDLCWSAAQMLSALDLKLGAYYGSLHLLDALESGDPTHVGLSLALEAVHLSASERTRARSRELIASARALVAQGRVEPYGRAFIDFGESMVFYLAGDWERALELQKRTESTLVERCEGVVWELDAARLYQFLSHEMMGSFEHFVEDLPGLLEESRRRGDLLCTTNLMLWSYRGHLANDDPDLARRALDEAITNFGSRDFLVQHAWYLIGSVNTALYAGDPERAREVIDAQRAGLRRSLLLQNDTIAAFMRDLEVRTAIALMHASREDPRAARKHRALAQKLTKKQLATSLPFARVMGLMARAQLEWESGEARSAAASLEQAEALASERGCVLHLHAIRFWRGELMGKSSPQGAALLAGATAWFEAHAVRSPSATVRHLLPASRPHASAPGARIII